MRMERADMIAIEKFATGHLADERPALLKAAIEAHRKYIAVPATEWNAHMNFMSEVDNPCPDYGLRARYRKELFANRTLAPEIEEMK